MRIEPWITVALTLAMRYHNPMKTIIILCAYLFLCSYARATHDYQLEVYGTAGNDMRVMLEVVDTILDGEGRSIADPRGGRIFVRTSPAKHKALREAFSQTAATARNIQLSVRFAEQRQEQEDAAALEGEISHDPSGTRWRIRPRAQHRSETTEQDTQQMLVTRSGHDATLRVGKRLPYLEWTADYSRFHSRIHVGTRWQDVGAFLVCKPTLQPDGETILIRMTPEIRGQGPDRSAQSYRFRSIETEVMVRNGQTIQVGEWSEANTLFNQFLIGRTRQSSRSNLKIHITPSILP